MSRSLTSFSRETMQSQQPLSVKSIWDGHTRPTAKSFLSPELDQPKNVSAVRKLLICSSPRTSSKRLARLLYSAGVGIPMEYFNPLNLPILSQRWSQQRGSELLVEDYTSELVARRSINGLFSATIQFGQLEKYLMNPSGKRFFDGAILLYLRRTDLEKQAVSLAAASLTNHWGFEIPEIENQFSEKQMRDALVAAIDLIHRENAGWLQFFSELKIKPVEVTSDEVNQQHFSLIQRIAEMTNLVVDRTKLELMDCIDHPYEGQRRLKQDLSRMLTKESWAFNKRL